MAILILNYMIITARCYAPPRVQQIMKQFTSLILRGGSYYYMRIFAYGDTAFQEYSLDYAFPVEVSEATIDADAAEGAGGNETYSSASSVALVSATENLTLHTATDQDWYSFEMRNASSSSSEISVSYDAGYSVRYEPLALGGGRRCKRARS